MYYALAKKSREDKTFCLEFLGGKSILVNKIMPFSDMEESQLIKSILTEKSKGKSVRQAIFDLTKGDSGLALRYQNKFRNAVKLKPDMVKKIGQDLNLDNSFYATEKVKSIIPESMFCRLKSEINMLIQRLSIKLERENQELKERISYLKLENLRLNNMLYGGGGKAVAFFGTDKKNELVN